MNARVQVGWLDDGRLHLNDGPIDLVIFADGAAQARRDAFAAATARFAGILDELCAELSWLRSSLHEAAAAPIGAVARRMDAATRPLSENRFLTPMAAVAGAVADEILAAMTRAASLRRAYVNNGGDIAVHLSEDATLKVGIVDRPDQPSVFGAAAIDRSHGVGGVATSGWRGRSFSFGIADAATVLAADAAGADAAATLIANAVDLPDHRAIVRAPANDIDPQSDLGGRLVTRSVGPLSDREVVDALDSGETEARRLIVTGAIIAASIRLRGATRVVGRLAARSPVVDIHRATDGSQSNDREERTWRQTFASS